MAWTQPAVQWKKSASLFIPIIVPPPAHAFYKIHGRPYLAHLFSLTPTHASCFECTRSLAQRARTPFGLPFHLDNNINLKQSKLSPFCVLLGGNFCEASARLSTFENIPAHKNVICGVEKKTRSSQERPSFLLRAPRFSSFDIHTHRNIIFAACFIFCDRHLHWRQQNLLTARNVIFLVCLMFYFFHLRAGKSS